MVSTQCWLYLKINRGLFLSFPDESKEQTSGSWGFLAWCDLWLWFQRQIMKSKRFVCENEHSWMLCSGLKSRNSTLRIATRREWLAGRLWGPVWRVSKSSKGILYTLFVGGVNLAQLCASLERKTLNFSRIFIAGPQNAIRKLGCCFRSHMNFE